MRRQLAFDAIAFDSSADYSGGLHSMGLSGVRVLLTNVPETLFKLSKIRNYSLKKSNIIRFPTH